MIRYYFYVMKPHDETSWLPFDEVIARITKAFPVHGMSPDEPRRNAALKLQKLIDVGAPEHILKDFREIPTTRSTSFLVYGRDPERHLHFDVWENQAIEVHPHPNNTATSCLAMVKRLADALGYGYVQEIYD